MQSVVLIPARMESTRFPNKPLSLIKGKPMIQWVYEAVADSYASDVFVITDSDKIMEAVDNFDGDAILTSSKPRNGTERCLEAMEILDPDGDQYDVIINVQGDEPLIQASEIDAMLDLFEDEEIDVLTLIQQIDSEEAYRNPNIVKAIPTLFEDDFCDISYFSRSPVPYMKEFVPGNAFKHIGVYGFTATALAEIASMPPSPLEEMEQLEQLRWIQNHLLISGLLTENTYIGVDKPDDIQAVENFLTSIE
ncbi:3-deoxy-manno-octulosonate cytidylyltransferase [bacterium]|nr:3-deoxy-manno-octulosonate cytidylyltransferase [bacterium]